MPSQNEQGKTAELTQEEVLQILELIEKSSFDYLELQLGDLKLTVSKSGVRPQGGSASGAEPAASARPATKVEIEAIKPGASARAPKPAEAPVLAQVPLREGTAPIKAPMVGTFYTTPEPGAPPFVQAGSHVEEDTTVGLIEVMKVFNAVKSGIRGVITEVCVQNGQFVEYGQTLFLVRPELALEASE